MTKQAVQSESTLTAAENWDARWSRLRLPVVLDRKTSHLVAREMIRVFDRYLPEDPNQSIVEVGGAPGQFLAYFRRQYGYEIASLDYSEVGCQKTRENFELLGERVTIYQRDLFDDLGDLPSFDIVYSLGLIEHFGDPGRAVQQHLKLLRPGGLLMLGVPNFRGVYRPVLQQIAPMLLAQHNLDAMDANRWALFEKDLGLEVLFREHIGGFEPRYFRKKERLTLGSRTLRSAFKPVRILVTDRMPFLRRFNSPIWSAYLLGVYRYTGSGGRPPVENHHG
jgi:SAM-dependent methyltransferase